MIFANHFETAPFCCFMAYIVEVSAKTLIKSYLIFFYIIFSNSILSSQLAMKMVMRYVQREPICHVVAIESYQSTNLLSISYRQF